MEFTITVIAIVGNVIQLIMYLARSEERRVLRETLKAIATQGHTVDRNEIVKLTVEALAGQQKSLTERMAVWAERFKALRGKKAPEEPAAATTPASPAPVTNIPSPVAPVDATAAASLPPFDFSAAAAAPEQPFNFTTSTPPAGTA